MIAQRLRDIVTKCVNESRKYIHDDETFWRLSADVTFRWCVCGEVILHQISWQVSCLAIWSHTTAIKNTCCAIYIVIPRSKAEGFGDTHRPLVRPHLLKPMYQFHVNTNLITNKQIVSVWMLEPVPNSPSHWMVTCALLAIIFPWGQVT